MGTELDILREKRATLQARGHRTARLHRALATLLLVTDLHCLRCITFVAWRFCPRQPAIAPCHVTRLRNLSAHLSDIQAMVSLYWSRYLLFLMWRLLATQHGCDRMRRGFQQERQSLLRAHGRSLVRRAYYGWRQLPGRTAARWDQTAMERIFRLRTHALLARLMAWWACTVTFVLSMRPGIVSAQRAAAAAPHASAGCHTPPHHVAYATPTRQAALAPSPQGALAWTASAYSSEPVTRQEGPPSMQQSSSPRSAVVVDLLSPTTSPIRACASQPFGAAVALQSSYRRSASSAQAPAAATEPVAAIARGLSVNVAAGTSASVPHAEQRAFSIIATVASTLRDNVALTIASSRAGDGGRAAPTEARRALPPHGLHTC